MLLSIIKRLLEHYPDVADTYVRVIPMEDRDDLHLYFRNANEYECVYSGLDQQCILGFLVKLKNKKEEGKFYGCSHVLMPSNGVS